mgnify:CR=1 FL=1
MKAIPFTTRLNVEIWKESRLEQAHIRDWLMYHSKLLARQPVRAIS